ncbi:MAG: TldD/PmbA family protein [Elusimicrobia bacterium]|nr:TldD/PmbA family protein [Elusimicrobiota bacterium]
MTDKNFFRDIFAKAQKTAGHCAGIEIFADKTADTTIVWSDKKLEDFYISESQGVGIKIIKNGKVGSAYTNNFNEQSTDDLISSALKNSEFLQQDEYVSLAIPSKMPARPELDICDDSFGKEPLEKRIALIKKMEDIALANNKIRNVVRAVYSESLGETHIMNSNDLELSVRGTVFSYGISCVASDGKEIQIGSESKVTRIFKEIDFESVTNEAVKNSVDLLGAKKVKTGSYSAVFNQNVACEFLALLDSSFSAYSVQKNVSLLKEKLNEKVCSDKLDIIDDGTLSSGVATSSFDDEGTPTQQTVLVEKGVLKNYLYDLYTANKDNVKSTGNSSRSYSGISRPAPTNIYIQKGNFSFNELLKSIAGGGLLITETMGMHNADAVSGEFSVGVNGFFVENGVKKFPIHGVTIAGNILDLFGSVVDVGNDLKFYGNTGSPSLLVNRLSVAGE